MNHNFRRLPPLHTLIAFESAARHNSFKIAAEELHRTPSAISHQIKSLESSLGMSLFLRHNRQVELSEAGREYAGVVREILNRLGNATERVKREHTRGCLRISIGAFVANEIIVPALPQFQALHPHVNVVLDTDPGTVDLSSGSVDVAMRFGRGHWPKLTSHAFMDVTAVPVCAPEMAEQLAKCAAGDVRDMTLIHSSATPDGWATWARAVDVELQTPLQELWVDSYLGMLRAAERGVGLCIGLLPMIRPWLNSGQLVRPWPECSVRLKDRYYAVHRETDQDNPLIQSFVVWAQKLLQEKTSSRKNG